MMKKLAVASAFLFALVAHAGVEVNKATEAELDGIRGIGPTTTKQILAERQKAPFKDWDDLIQRVKGIGTPRAEKLSAEGLTVAGNPYGTRAAAGMKDPKADPKSAKKQ